MVNDALGVVIRHSLEEVGPGFILVVEMYLLSIAGILEIGPCVRNVQKLITSYIWTVFIQYGLFSNVKNSGILTIF